MFWHNGKVRISKEPNFIANDATARWRKMARNANKSIVVFSPYLDTQVSSLLQTSSLPVENKVVVTDLSPDSGALDYLAQLKALRTLIQKGVEVRSLPRLHAKVLWVDEFLVSVGSQNFTKYARASKETTGFHIEELEIESLHQNLARWLSDSEPVSIVLLCELIDGLAVKSQDKVKAHAALVQAFHNQVETHKFQIEQSRKSNEAEQRQRLADLQEHSTLRLGQSKAFGHLVWKPNANYEWYQTMMVDKGYDLTRWYEITNGRSEVRNLGSKRMFPILLADSERMGFARVTRTRITYIRLGVVLSNFMLPGFESSKLSIQFPSENTHSVNLEMIFHQGNRARYAYECKFNGEKLDIVSERYIPYSPLSAFSQSFSDAAREQITNSEILEQIFSNRLNGFRFSELGIKDKNAADFFAQEPYSFGAITFAGAPIVVATPLSIYLG